MEQTVPNHRKVQKTPKASNNFFIINRTSIVPSEICQRLLFPFKVSMVLTANKQLPCSLDRVLGRNLARRLSRSSS